MFAKKSTKVIKNRKTRDVTHEQISTNPRGIEKFFYKSAKVESGSIFKIPPIPSKFNRCNKRKLVNQITVNQFGHNDRPSKVIYNSDDNFLPTVEDNFRSPAPAKYHKLTRRFKFIL